MKNPHVYLVTLLSVFGFFNSTAQASLCERASDLGGFTSHLSRPENRLSFRNYGGLLGGGVCWWHSRFQRAATYLAEFDASKPKPNRDGAKKIIRSLAKLRGVTIVPGYSDLRSFSLDWASEIQEELERWQIKDGFLRFSWVDGLAGTTSKDPEKLAALMDQLFHEVNELQKIVYVKLQVPGIPAHAWLVSDMSEVPDGYELTIVDSNHLSMVKIAFRKGQTTIVHDFGTSMPYLRRQKDFHVMLSEVLRYCRPEVAHEKWTRVLRERLDGASDPSIKRLINWSLDRAGEGQFTPLFRDEVLSDQDLTPDGWRSLMKN